MRTYSTSDPPPVSLWWENYDRAIGAGLNERTAERFAYLTWWGEHYGVKTPAIVSGSRSGFKQKVMRVKWDLGMRGGMVARPAEDSAHETGDAFDLQNTGALHMFGKLAPYAGLRWGGNFADPDPNHFDSRR